jgi:hypothetical protein
LSTRWRGRNEKLLSLPLCIAPSRHDLIFFSFSLPVPTMLSRSPTPNTSHEVLVVQAILSFRIQPISKKDTTKSTKKSTVAKGKTESKTKEMKFTFESSEENYLSFLSALLKVHGHDKYTPVKKHCRFGVKVSVAKKVYVSNFVYQVTNSLLFV